MPKKSSCNGPSVKFFRDRLQWTQEALAKNASLSVRVVAKAEASEMVAQKTIESLARAFQEAGLAVKEGDLVNDPASLARKFLKNYATHQADCVTHSLDLLSPDIVAFIDGDPATNPIAGEYRGLQEFDQFWKKFFALFVRDGGTIDDPQIIASGNDVIAFGHEIIRVREVQPTGAAGFVMLRIRFENGKMVRFEDYYESSGMMRTLKDWAVEFPDADWTKLLPSETLAGMNGRE